ncbi:16816_t:CDS:10, partial [Acaulospora colombiana]
MASYPRVNRQITVERCEKFISESFFTDVNLRSSLYVKRTGSEKYIQLLVYKVPSLKRISFEEAVKGNYEPAKRGDTFGPSWSTHWFHVHVTIPEDWKHEEVQFVWDANNEGMEVIAAESNMSLRVAPRVARNLNSILRWLVMVELTVPNQRAWKLFYDFEIILEMAKEIPHDTMRSAQALHTANSIVNAFRPNDESSIDEALDISREFLKHKNGNTQLRLTAVGNCHIDTAWLWPFDETKRKVARSWSTQIGLMELYPDYKFVCSQAQQFEWLKIYYPELFKKVQEKSADGQFLPIGGTWVEMDCNLPSGEAFCRQFLFGPGELIRSVRNHKDKELSDEALLLFGNGDGGGGPLASMIERLHRLRDVDGLAKVDMGSADDFYERLERNSSELVSWKGELYFELHRGTYTSHGRIKRYNRKSELLLRDVEILSTFASHVEQGNGAYPKETLEELWKYVLLNQFHDVLPGSSIEMVYDDAYKFYEDVEKRGIELREKALGILLGKPSSTPCAEEGLLVFNTLGWSRTEVVEVPVSPGLGPFAQYATDQKSGYVLVKDTAGLGIQSVDVGISDITSPAT